VRRDAGSGSLMAARRKKSSKKKARRKQAAARRPRGYVPPRPSRAQRTRAARVVQRLQETYPRAECALEHRNAFELLAATILSAQCTDERVNMVTPRLFERWPTPAALARATPADVEDVIRSTGFFRNKTKNLIGMAQRVTEVYGGEVPRDMDDLLSLPGVARKTANVVRGVMWDLADGVVVDTHVGRISRLLGWTEKKDPAHVEKDLMALHPQSVWVELSHMLIHHGRRICIARRPRCDECPLNRLCPSATVGP
jgi:endonuclease-3